jgi:hypothetical protein
MIGRPALLMLLIVTAPRVARGDDRAEAMEHAVKGNRSFDLGDYDEAIKEYAAAYRIKDDPALLYNLAQANRQAGHKADAKRFYRVYLARVPEAANRHEVELRIAELDRADGPAEPLPRVVPAGSGAATVASSRPAVKPVAPSPAVEPAAPPPVAPVVTPEPKPAATVDAAAAATAAPERAPRAPAGPGVVLERAGIGAAAGGLAVVVGGIVCGALAHGDANTLTSLAHHGGTFEPGQESAGKALQATEGALIGVGAAAVVAGVVLYVVGRRQARRAAEAPAAPDPATAAATLAVRF